MQRIALRCIRKTPPCRFFASLTKVPDSVWEKALEMRGSYNDLQKQLEQPDLAQDKFIALSKQISSVQPVAEFVKKVESALDTLNELEELQKDADKEMSALAELELSVVTAEMVSLEEGLLDFFIEKDDDDSRNAILEVRAGVGGGEASLFANEMFKMYEKFCTSQQYRFKTLDTQYDDASGGLKEGRALVSGENVFGVLKFEVGGHRVQRVPVTESSGRIHTSAITVTVMPEAQVADVQVNEKTDLRIDYYRSSGAGGQHVNTTDSACRITHIPTGIVAMCQDERSQQNNKASALKVIYSRIYERERDRINQERNALMASQLVSGDRSERIRTYNFAQNRITDHRLNESQHNIDNFFTGETLIDFINTLEAEQRLRGMEALSQKYAEKSHAPKEKKTVRRKLRR